MSQALGDVQGAEDQPAQATLAEELAARLTSDVAGAAPADRIPWIRAFEALAAHCGSEPEDWLSSNRYYQLLDHSVYYAAESPGSALVPFLTYHALIHNVASGRYSSSIERLLTALDRPEHRGEMITPWARALASERARLSGKFDEASEWLAGARRTVNGRGPAGECVEERIGRTLLALHTAKLHLDLGRKRAALRGLEAAEVAIESLGGFYELRDLAPAPECLGLAADAFQLRLATLSALGLFKAAERAAREPTRWPLGDRVTARVHYELGVILARTGEPARADETLAQCLETLGVDPFTRILALLERSYIALDQGDRSAFETLVEQASTALASRPDLTLPAARLAGLQALGMSTAQESGRAERRASIQAAFDSQLAAWSGTSLSEGGVGFLDFGPRRFLFEQLLTDAVGRGDDAAALATVGEAEACGTLARRLGARPATLEDVQSELLGEGEGLIVFVPSWRAVHAFAVDAHEVVHARLPSLDELQPLISAATSEYRGFASDGTPNALEALSAAILPLSIGERVRGWSALTFVGAGVLGLPPTPALRLARPDGRGTDAIGLTLPVAELPSMTMGLALARRAHPATGEVRSPRVVLGTEPGEQAEREYRLDPVTVARSVRKRIGRCELIEGAAASAAALKAPPACLLLFGHGVADPLRRTPTGLVLGPSVEAPSGVLFAADLRRVWAGRHSLDLVFVAACHAGRGPTRLGDDESDTLFATLVELGARCTVVSRETLFQDAAAEFMAAFLEAHDASGRSPAEALLQARRAVAARAEFAAPRYWSPLAAMGLAHRRGVGR